MSGTGPLSTPRATELRPPRRRATLGNGVKHVISLVFDNVHFSRDNPNVPSDLEQMPHLLNFLKYNGTVLSNTHTPLIAHTADDSLTIYTGLYGDRHGQPLSNSYKTYNADGTTDPATSFAYWTSPVVDTAGTPTAGHDATPTMVYSPTVPAVPGATGRQTPAPWVPFTRAGCSTGDFSTANMVLENTRLDLNTVFGPSSPEVAQLNADGDSFKDPEVADYIGAAVHCAHGDAICASAQAVKFGQTTPSPTAVPDQLPTEPGGYPGYQALFGARYIAPQLGAGTPNLTRNGYAVTNAAGNLVDLNGNQINGAFLTNHPGFPGSARRRASPWPTSRTCRRAASRSPTATSPTCTNARPAPAAVPQRPRPARASRSDLVTRATSPTPRTTTPRSRRSSSDCTRTASPRRTPSS